MVIQKRIFFPTRPQSANVGLAFSPTARERRKVMRCTFPAESKTKWWIFRFDPKGRGGPISGRARRAPDTKGNGGLSWRSAMRVKGRPGGYNKGKAALYPAGVGPPRRTADGLVVCQINLGDSGDHCGAGLQRGHGRMERSGPAPSGERPGENIYPYGCRHDGKR